jgi:phosphoribosylformimino-5-aminoimidazole carboxamide ribotide isomerase
MLVLPAIDIKDGKCVRLSQGNFDSAKVYSQDPAETALRWQEKGASYLHVVDLDGAKSGSIANWTAICEIVEKVEIPVQVGGGIRDKDAASKLFDIGVKRIVLGTAAICGTNLLQDLLSAYGKDKIAVSLDVKNGRVCTDGWEKLSHVNPMDLCRILHGIGVKTIVYTDTLRDGMLSGPNFSAYQELSQVFPLRVIASGGISSIQDLVRLKEIGLYGASVGKALYEGILNLDEVMKCPGLE